MIIFAYAILYFSLSFHRHDRSNKDDDELESMKKDKDTKAHLDNACLCTYSLAGSQVYDLVLLVPSWAHDMSCFQQYTYHIFDS